MVSNCRKRLKESSKPATAPKKKPVEKEVQKNIAKDLNAKEFVINLEIDHSEQVELQNMTRVVESPIIPVVQVENTEDEYVA
ncbi:unnamed protein product [Lupinus luteus]|uniref:Uncharacterized protein n=1 Tax=Lupinus luteus TaxID=3873 RepID=A0AAV1YHA5_LUPLU